MKRLVMTMLVFAALLPAAEPSVPRRGAVHPTGGDYTGNWLGKGAIESTKYPGGIPETVQMTLQQTGSSLTGMVKVGRTVHMISTGAIMGNQITFAIQSKSGQVTARLADNGGTLKGSMTLTTGEVYDVVFARK